jgi:hypothetical protein
MLLRRGLGDIPEEVSAAQSSLVTHIPRTIHGG